MGPKKGPRPGATFYKIRVRASEYTGHELEYNEKGEVQGGLLGGDNDDGGEERKEKLNAEAFEGSKPCPPSPSSPSSPSPASSVSRAEEPQVRTFEYFFLRRYSEFHAFHSNHVSNKVIPQTKVRGEG